MKSTIEKARTFDRSGGVDHGRALNIASYAPLAMTVARVTGYEPGAFVHTFGDVPLYLDHLGQADRRLRRVPFPLPRARLRGECLNRKRLNEERRSLLDFRKEDVEPLDYRHHRAFFAPISV